MLIHSVHPCAVWCMPCAVWRTPCAVIISDSSDLSLRATCHPSGLQDHTVYCATKGALDQMTRVRDLTPATWLPRASHEPWPVGIQPYIPHSFQGGAIYLILQLVPALPLQALGTTALPQPTAAVSCFILMLIGACG